MCIVSVCSVSVVYFQPAIRVLDSGGGWGVARNYGKGRSGFRLSLFGYSTAQHSTAQDLKMDNFFYFYFYCFVYFFFLAALMNHSPAWLERELYVLSQKERKSRQDKGREGDSKPTSPSCLFLLFPTPGNVTHQPPPPSAHMSQHDDICNAYVQTYIHR